MLPWTIRPTRTQLTITYCLSFTMFGLIVGGIGPIIPIKALEMDVKETRLGIAFAMKGIGGLLGSFLSPSIEGLMSINKAIAVSCAIIGMASGSIGSTDSLFVFSSMFFIMGLAIMIINIMCTVSIIRIHTKQNAESWIKALHLSFGIGAFLSPLWVSYYGLTSFKIFPILALVLTILLVFYSYPDSDRQTMVEDNTQDEETFAVERRPIPPNLDLIIALFMFVYAGFEVGYWGWISTFGTMTPGISTEQSLYSASIFWVSMTAGRALSIPLSLICSTSQQLLMLVVGSSLSMVASMFLLMNGKELVIIYYISCAMGLFCSGIYPLTMNLPNSLGLKTSTRNTSKYALGGSIGESVLPFFAGLTIDWFGREAMFIDEIILGICLIILYFKAISIGKSATMGQREPLQMALLKGELHQVLDN